MQDLTERHISCITVTADKVFKDIESSIGVHKLVGEHVTTHKSQVEEFNMLLVSSKSMKAYSKKCCQRTDLATLESH